jgi:hypothetical protein
MIDPEDEAFNDIERQAKQRKEAVKAAMRRAEDDDDDIQVYQRTWVGLTDEEWLSLGCKSVEEVRIGLAIQAKLKEKNT